MVEELSRRQTDHHKLIQLEDKIIQLIEATDNTKDKAYLLILMKINDSMISNTTSINTVTDEIKEISIAFEERNKAHDAIINRGKGWRDILVWVLGGIQAFGIWAILHLNTEFKNLHKDQETQKVELVKHIASDISIVHTLQKGK